MDYLDALTTYIDATNIESVGRDDGRQCIVFTNEKSAHEAIVKGLEINGTHISGIPVCIKPTRVILSQIPSFMPEDKIIDYLKQFGKLVTWLRPIPINSNNIAKYQHILSFRREIFIQLNESTELPNKFKINFNGVIHSIYIETEATCYKCKLTGHMTHSCPLLNPSLPPILTKPPIQAIPSISSIPLFKNLQRNLQETTNHHSRQQLPSNEHHQSTIQQTPQQQVSLIETQEESNLNQPPHQNLSDGNPLPQTSSQIMDCSSDLNPNKSSGSFPGPSR